MNLLLHMLLRWEIPDEHTSGNDNQPLIERLLGFDILTDEAVVINIFDSHALPFLRSCQQILQARRDNILHLPEIDPFSRLMLPEEKLSLKQRKHRDTAWAEIAPLLEHEDAEFMLYASKRGPLVKTHSQNVIRSNRQGKPVQLSITTIHKRLRLWWQSGRRKNVFVPSFDRCGAPGKKRLADTSQIDIHNHKVGRRSALAISSGCSDTGMGVRMTADIYRKFEKGLNKFYNTMDGISLTEAFKQTINRYFAVGYEIVDGKPVPILPAENERPTFNQFYYWYEHTRNDGKEQRAREGDIQFELKSRSMLGDPTKMGFAPGSLYQIDATILDLYAVSEFDRTRIIGRPIQYYCIDVFSAALTGFCVTLEGPSWLGAMLALDNVAMNKVDFCAEYGNPISEEEWPCMGLPAGILADRGEFEGYNPNTLVNAFGMHVHNTGVRRADWKGLTERHFGIARERVCRFTPGYVPPKKRLRGDPDYALRAALTLDDIRKLTICHALDYNMNHYLKSYRKNEFMIADHVPIADCDCV
jgi:putative transposase